MRGAPHAHPLSAVDSVCEGVAPVVLAASFRVNGPATRLQLRDWLGSDPTAAWQQADDLVRVRIAGPDYELPEALLDAV
ncbi:hypothetical protein [Nocardia asiatica]|uniref:hypothetical protein n=1 Tax=Nocardia asiatica TaxID=209252 RepID=UPI002454B384|nr:hypothetical protein [Nocardia asiatica]